MSSYNSIVINIILYARQCHHTVISYHIMVSLISEETIIAASYQKVNGAPRHISSSSWYLLPSSLILIIIINSQSISLLWSSSASRSQSIRTSLKCIITNNGNTYTQHKNNISFYYRHITRHSCY